MECQPKPSCFMGSRRGRDFSNLRGQGSVTELVILCVMDYNDSAGNESYKLILCRITFMNKW